LDLAKGVGNARHFEDCLRLSEHDGSSSVAFGGISLRPIETQHYIPCWGFRIEADGRRLAYTADTAPCGGLSDLASDADLLLSEATLRSLDEDARAPEPRGHLLPAEAGAAARDGGSRRLMLTHLPVNGDGSWAGEGATESFGAEVEIAEPNRSYEI
ncbi:MAG TPA: MBL fold metallo-hydrolase, partial [Candidatus Binatia bacterium]|nr:MBL fold metallo-hydrolase [Candidatus Binatia bacterium]